MGVVVESGGVELLLNKNLVLFLAILFLALLFRLQMLLLLKGLIIKRGLGFSVRVLLALIA